MPRPALLAVDGDPAARRGIEGELRKRYGADCEVSGAAALGTLEQIGARGGQVALVLADLRLPDMSGTELMAKVHGLDPAAKRALLTGCCTSGRSCTATRSATASCPPAPRRAGRC